MDAAHLSMIYYKLARVKLEPGIRGTKFHARGVESICLNTRNARAALFSDFLLFDAAALGRA